MNESLEDLDKLVGCLSGYVDAVVSKPRRPLFRKEEVERLSPCDKILDGNPIHRLFHLLVEVVDPKVVEIAQDRVPRPVGNQVDPVVEKLVIVAAQVLSTALHFHYEPGFPNEIGEPYGPAVPGDSEFESRSRLSVAVVAEGLEEAVTEDLSLSLLVSCEGLRVGYEIRQGRRVRRCLHFSVREAIIQDLDGGFWIGRGGELLAAQARRESQGAPRRRGNW